MKNSTIYSFADLFLCFWNLVLISVLFICFVSWINSKHTLWIYSLAASSEKPVGRRRRNAPDALTLAVTSASSIMSGPQKRQLSPWGSPLHPAHAPPSRSSFIFRRLALDPCLWLYLQAAPCSQHHLLHPLHTSLSNFFVGWENNRQRKAKQHLPPEERGEKHHHSTRKRRRGSSTRHRRREDNNITPKKGGGRKQHHPRTIALASPDGPLSSSLPSAGTSHHPSYHCLGSEFEDGRGGGRREVQSFEGGQGEDPEPNFVPDWPKAGFKVKGRSRFKFQDYGFGSVKYWYVCSTSLAHFSFLPTQLLRQRPETRQNTWETMKKDKKTNGDNKMRKHKRIMKKREKTEALCLWIAWVSSVDIRFFAARKKGGEETWQGPTTKKEKGKKQPSSIKIEF